VAIVVVRGRRLVAIVVMVILMIVAVVLLLSRLRRGLNHGGAAPGKNQHSRAGQKKSCEWLGASHRHLPRFAAISLLRSS
jgi:hypothetical protein